jgi:hypothetical protein
MFNIRQIIPEKTKLLDDPEMQARS